MQQMIRNMVNRLTMKTLPARDLRRWASVPHWFGRTARAFGIAAALLVGPTSTDVLGQGVSLANYDMEASGFVVPAGMPPMSAAGIPGMGTGGSPVMPVGYSQCGCDSGGCNGGCDGMQLPMQACMDRMVCGTCGGGGGCDCNSFLGGGGILGKMRNGGGSPCLFCRGAGCTACQETPFGYAGSCLAGAVAFLRPYEEARLCNQRWYDVSVEMLSLSRGIEGIAPGVVTTNGIGGAPVLSLSDIDDDSLEEGVRLSAAFIWGVGGNIEATYMGGNEWNDSAAALSPEATLYSFISEFGVTPAGGFDDTDRSVRQALTSTSQFHSAEINYRRRTMFPYCRFQSSWLVGLRYLRYDDKLVYRTDGLNINTVTGDQPTFFESGSSNQNKLFGPQAGFDFWWNVVPGVSLGVGSKVAWMQNDVDRRTTVVANSIPLTGGGVISRGVTADDGDQEATVMADFELKMVYRLTHSLSVRGSYYALAVDDAAFGALDPNLQFPSATSALVVPQIQYDDLVLQGYTAGLEYIW